MEASFEKF